MKDQQRIKAEPTWVSREVVKGQLEGEKITRELTNEDK